MAAVDLADLERRARRAYERGRLRRAIAGAWPVVVLAAIAMTAGARPWRIVAISMVLVGVVVVLLHRGGGWMRGVLPGLFAGSLPMVAGLFACRLPHACGGSVCLSWCAPLCGVAALIGGAMMARRARGDREHRRAYLLAGSAVAVLTGALGCMMVGVGGLGGLALGLALTAAPALARARGLSA